MSTEALISVVLVTLLVVLSGFFSSAEAAFLSVERLRLAHLVQIGKPGARRVAEMLSQPARLLSTILLGNNMVNVAFTALITVIAIDIVGEGAGVLAATFIGTATLLILGEIVPKTLAVNYAQPIAFLYAGPLKAMELIFWPIIALLNFISRVFTGIFHLQPEEKTSITEAELRTMLSIGEAEGTFSAAEVELVRKAVGFGRRQVSEIMTPRPEIYSVEMDATLGDFLQTYAECGHTRLPVLNGDDDIIGLVSAKDVLTALSKDPNQLDQPTAPLMREVSYIPETKLLSPLFNEMRQSGDQMIIVLDEHGSVSGLVTLKALAEEVVGAIGEEGSAPEEHYVSIDEDVFRVEGGMNIHEANESMLLDLPTGDYDTVAGFVLEVLGDIPTEGEQFSYGSLRFEVEKMKRHRIESVKVTKLRLEAEDGAAQEADVAEHGWH